MDAEKVVAEAERYAAEGALAAEHGELVEDVERQLRLSASGLTAAAHAAQDALMGLYLVAKAHAAVQATSARRLAAVMPQRFAEGSGFDLHGVRWEPLDPGGILLRTVAYVRLEADGVPAPPPGDIPPLVFDDGQ